MLTQSDKNKQILDEAIIIKACAERGKDAIQGKTPKDILSDHIEEALHSLFVYPTGGREDNNYGMEAWEFKSFMHDLLALLAKPGILEQLPNRQDEAAARLNSLYYFFDHLDIETTVHYLDYLGLVKYCGFVNGKEANNRLSYYDFSKRNSGIENYFNTLKEETAKEEKQAAVYEEIDKLL